MLVAASLTLQLDSHRRLIVSLNFAGESLPLATLVPPLAGWLQRGAPASSTGPGPSNHFTTLDKEMAGRAWTSAWPTAAARATSGLRL